MEMAKAEAFIEQETRVYSVDEVTNYIRTILAGNKYLSDIWITGEISNFNHYNGQHMYFRLKDDKSVIDCAMFQGANENLAFMPKDGMKVIIRGYIDVYKPRGEYRITVTELHLEGQGVLYLQFLQLKEKLEKEGLFRQEHKKQIPRYPKSIGIVTSTEGAVIHDIIKIIKRRYPGVKLVVAPSLVQGNQAKYAIAKGIAILNRGDIDVMIIARGGGSFEDLWPFNEELVARAIYASRIPVISAIGHETDFTIADFVADKRAPTPSTAAEMATPDREEIFSFLKGLERRACNQIKNYLEHRKQKINQISANKLYKKPQRIMDAYIQTLDLCSSNLINAFQSKVENLNSNVKTISGKLNALSPYSVLKRGYSITVKEGSIISSVKDISLGDVVSIAVSDGEIISQVKEKNERKNI